MADAPDIRSLVSQLHDALQRSSSFQALPQEKRNELMHDVEAIQRALGNGTSDPYALALDMPPGFNRGFPHSTPAPADAGPAPASTPAPAATPGPKAAATQTLA